MYTPNPQNNGGQIRIKSYYNSFARWCFSTKRNLYLWQLFGFAFTSLGGTLLHFLYDRTNESLLVAPFSAVNESTWEHMKLFYFPWLISALICRLFSDESENFWCVKLVGLLSGLTLIPVLFYTYNGAIGKSPDWLNISIFFVTAAAVFLFETRLFEKEKLRCKRPWIAFAAILFIGVLFFGFTFFPPKLPIFQDPLTYTYGLLL